MAVRLKGNKALLTKLGRLSKEGEELVHSQIEASLRDVQNEAQTRAPRDTGILKSSIVYKPTETGAKVVVNAHYGAYVEFGTGAKVDVPSGLEDYAVKFKGKGVKQVNLPARPFLFPVFFRESKELMERLRKGLSTIAKR